MTKKSVTQEELLAKIRQTYQGDADAIERAYFFAKQKHQGQKRKSGEDYIIHPMAVADLIVDMGMDAQTVQAAFLHDVLEDTDCTREEMEEQFGKEVVELVEGVTKLDKINFSSKQQAQAENLRKMLLAISPKNLPASTGALMRLCVSAIIYKETSGPFSGRN